MHFRNPSVKETGASRTYSRGMPIKLFVRGQEIELQKLVANWLNLHSIYYEWDRPE